METAALSWHVIHVEAFTPILLSSATPYVCVWRQLLWLCVVDEGEVHCATNPKKSRVSALPKAQDFFISSVLPELLTRRHDPALETQSACKYCERPDFGKMINCIKCNNHCHYSCVQIKRKPATWLCRECQSWGLNAFNDNVRPVNVAVRQMSSVRFTLIAKQIK